MMKWVLPIWLWAACVGALHLSTVSETALYFEEEFTKINAQVDYVVRTLDQIGEELGQFGLVRIRECVRDIAERGHNGRRDLLEQVQGHFRLFADPGENGTEKERGRPRNCWFARATHGRRPIG